MYIKKTKSREDWKNIIGRLSSKDFEYLCYELVKVMPGFTNVDLRDGSYDGGRDIEADYRSKIPDKITELEEKWRFECKRYSNGISFDDISNKINQVNLNKIDKLVIMSNMHLTPPCKDEIKKNQDKWYCKIIDWTGIHFQDILFQYPDVCKEFFPDEEIPQREFYADYPSELFSYTQRAGSHFGIELEIKLEKGQKPPTNIEEAADIIIQYLPKINILDLNIKSLIYHHIAGFFYNINREMDALFFLNESLKISPKNTAVLLNKGFILEKVDNLKDSTKCYDSILEINENNKYALNNKAHNLNRKGYFEEALALVNKTLDIDPDFIIAINNKVMILLNFDRAEEALEFLETKLKKFELSKLLLKAKVNLLIDLLDLKEAMKINENILKIDPEDIDAINNKGVIYEHNALFQKPNKYIPLAMECFENVTNKDMDYPLGWSNIIICLLHNNQINNATDALNKVYEKFESNVYINNDKGIILLKQNNPKKALKYFNKALNFDSLKTVWINKCRALLKLRQHDEVVKICDNLLKYDKKNQRIWTLRGIALLKLNNKTLAKKCFENAKKYRKKPRSLLE